MMRPALFVRDKKNRADAKDGVREQRRRFMHQLSVLPLLAATGIGASACRSAAPNANGPLLAGFLHGVASGDPLRDRVILWTRVTPQQIDEDLPIEVQWQVARDEAMREIVSAGTAVADAAADYTVKVDATGLKPQTHYFYRFSAAGIQSPIGRTKTLPDDGVEQVRLAVFSCANYPAGYFNVYADAAKQEGLDAALHIGDYIYEYESTGYGCDHAEALGRVSEPLNALMVLADYRRRYAQYRTDPDLQAVHAALPFIVVWDDHEFADDAWRDGAGEHNDAASGPFSHRKAAAIRAYHEWLPIRAPDPDNLEKIYRSFDFGKLVSLHMLDTRVVGRDQQLMLSSYYDQNQRFNTRKFKADVASPRRQMLGRTQMAWLEQRIANSGASWQILGQQVLMGRMEYPTPVAMGELACAEYVALQQRAENHPDAVSAAQRATLAAPSLPCYMDSWDGYQNDREQVFGMMRRHAKNLVVLTGDTHNAWASDLRDDMQRRVGVEFATASVSSPGLECTYPDRDPATVARMMEQMIEPLYYAQTSKRGYMIISATAAEVRCDWRFVSTVHSRAYTAAFERSLRTVAGVAGRRIAELG